MVKGIDQRELARLAKRLLLELREAAANTRDGSLARPVDVWRRGFVARQALLFDFRTYGFDAFVSEVERKKKLPRLNGNSNLFADKLFSYLYLREIAAPTPSVYAFTDAGRIVVLNERGDTSSMDANSMDALLQRHGKLVVKPRYGAHGRGFCRVERANGSIQVSGRRATTLEDCLSGQMIISEHIEQHHYARRIYVGATNTLRLLSMRDADTGEPFVAAALHRFGSERSKPVDNTGAGGLTAEVDLVTGVLGPLAAMPGCYLPHGHPVVWHDDHPDTGVRVTGTVVPRWSEVVDEVNRAMRFLPGLDWIGWDVVVTSDGFTLIEGNAGPDITFQVHRPLLLDERVQASFKAHGIISR